MHLDPCARLAGHRDQLARQRAAAQLREEPERAGRAGVAGRDPRDQGLSGRQAGGLRLDAQADRRRRRAAILGTGLDFEVRGARAVLVPAVGEAVGEEAEGERLPLSGPFRAGVVEHEETVAEAGDPGRDDLRVDRHLLPAVAVGRRGIGHAPCRAAVPQDHVAEVPTSDRPGEVGMPAMAERRAVRPDRVAAAGPLEPFRPDAADRHPPESLLAGFLQVERRRSDRPTPQRRRIGVEQGHLLDALELDPRRGAVVPIGLAAHLRDPGVARHVQADQSVRAGSLRPDAPGPCEAYCRGEQGLEPGTR